MVLFSSENEKINRQGNRRPKILVAPLGWGLGHATRCIPIIRELETRNCEVVIATGGLQRELLTAEFPKLRFLQLDGYGVRYGNSAISTRLRLLSQVPRILRWIRRERRWLRDLLDSERLDAIISDNRYGCHAIGLPCVLMTHQLAMPSLFGKSVDGLLRRFLYRQIRHFSRCWIPDDPEPGSLAGRLSHPPLLPQVQISYVGPITRWDPCPKGPIRHPLLILLSGPEPQRSLLEQILLGQLEGLETPALLVRGLPGTHTLPNAPQRTLVYNHLPSGDLRQLICASEWIVARSGYSSIMDLLRLGKKCIAIPTPGQPEQEYLAEYLHERKWIFRATQKGFDLKRALREAQAFPYAWRAEQASRLSEAVDDLLKSLASG